MQAQTAQTAARTPLSTARRALALALALAGLATPPARAGADEAAATVNQVNLVLTVTGVGKDGCQVEIKPGHPGCSFPAVAGPIAGLGQVRPIAGGYEVTLPPITAATTSADRDCSFAITLTEPGRAPKTYRRGLRLAPSAPAGARPTQTMTCYLSTPSVAARDDRPTARR